MINANDASGADEFLSKSHDKYIEKVRWKARMKYSSIYGSNAVDGFFLTRP